MSKEPIIWWRVHNKQLGHITAVKVVEEYKLEILITEVFGDVRPTLWDKSGWSSRFYDFSFYPSWDEAHEHVIKLMKERLQQEINSLARYKMAYHTVKDMKQPANPERYWENNSSYSDVQRNFSCDLNEEFFVNLNDTLWKLLEN